MDSLDIVTGDFELNHFISAEFTLLDEAVTGNHDEELPFGIVPMLSFRDARLGDIDGDLPAVERVDEFRERATVIGIHLERERDFRRREITQIGAVQFFGERPVRDVRNSQRLGLRGELVQQVHDLAQGSPVRRGHVTVSTVLHRKHPEPVEIAPVLLPFQAFDHLVHEIVDVQEFQFHRRVIDRVRQVVGNGVAEGRDGGIVVGTTPFTEEVREPVNEHLGARVVLIIQEKFLAGQFASAILGIAEPTRQTGLLATSEHHRASVIVLFERLEKGTGKTKVAPHELRGILRPVYAREIEHKVGLGAPLIQLCRARVDVVLEHLVDGHAIIPRLPVPDILQLRTQVPSHETLGAGHKYSHIAKIVIYPSYPPGQSAHTARP